MPRQRKTYRAEFNALADQLTDLYKAQIKKQNLIKTGFLYGSIRVKYKKTKGEHTFEVLAPDYFKYVDGNYSVSKKVMRSVAYKNIQKQLIKLYNLIVKDELLS